MTSLYAVDGWRARRPQLIGAQSFPTPCGQGSGHAFTLWGGSPRSLSDSGGFQVFPFYEVRTQQHGSAHLGVTHQHQGEDYVVDQLGSWGTVSLSYPGGP